ncbi:hypothetical protein TNIN_304091 [Trichonephila inaurata madagascariensis]|uniref:Uncharacterized protein n=1 Tax=Trichonephila inaurata madagascariensis TaxID=2747483 RepID=A0A8X6XYR2_9ARAC|nr:hypothetical protein TNIN_304091 [Trichonephila inaurata madagascariensis]
MVIVIIARTKSALSEAWLTLKKLALISNLIINEDKTKYTRRLQKLQSESIEINIGLVANMSYDCDFGEQWILSDCRCVLQHWSSINNDTRVSILVELSKISQTQDVYLYAMDTTTNQHLR